VDRREFVDWTAGAGVHSVGVSGDAQTEYRSGTYPKPLVLVLGSEREGLTADLGIEEWVSIPMHGQVDSLNLAVAAGIALYEVASRSGA
jgi:TrmH family RNA methyltransferase